jgi:hypothetical protein
MADLPAICERGHPYVDDAKIQGNVSIGTLNIKNAYATARCPTCGNRGRLVDGQYTMVEGITEVLRASEWTRHQLVALADAVDAARSAEDRGVLDGALDEAPGGDALRRFIPQDPGQFWTFVNALAAILLVLIALKGGDGDTTTHNEATINVAPQPSPRHVEQAPGRNDPCPCGSGRKYKKCHGR